MSEQENIKAATAFFDAWNAGDLSGSEAYQADNFVAENPGAAGPMNNEQNRQYLQNFMTAFPGSKFEVLLTIAQGDYVVQHWRATGTNSGVGGAIVRVARSLMRRYNIASVVVSMGKEGAIFVQGDETIWAVPPPVEVKSTVGAGDAMVAGTVAGKIRGLSLADCARLATAFSTTAISHIGHGLPSIGEVEDARERVTLREIATA